jgi:hypothetical protein
MTSANSRLVCALASVLFAAAMVADSSAPRLAVCVLTLLAAID